QEDSTTYRLLVILRPPPGHSFIPDPPEQLPANGSGTRVALQCVFSTGQLRGRRRCFLHAPGNQLPREQEQCPLNALCTDTYLDVEKVSRWVQRVVASAWRHLPQSSDHQLRELPSSNSCKCQLTGPSGMQVTTELVSAVQ
ncbi:IPIL1 protein, partial [Neodrepanis coruscans]|nr:IPIL1 protein [Neodrepanis coruscans]